MKYIFHILIISALILGFADSASYMYEKARVKNVGYSSITTIGGSYGFSGAKLVENKLGSRLSSNNSTLGVVMESGIWSKLISGSSSGLVEKSAETGKSISKKTTGSTPSLKDEVKIGDNKSLEPLFRALSDQDRKVQKNAATVLKDLGWNTSEEDQTNSKQLASAASSKQANEMLVKGRTLASQGKLDEAVQAFDGALKADPENISAWYLKGTVLAWQGKGQDAYECYDRIATVKGGNSLNGVSILSGTALLQFDQMQPRKSGIFNSYIGGSVLDPYGRLPIIDSTIDTLVLCGGAPKTKGTSRIKVCPSGCDYTDFKSAIDAAMPGETLDVAEGIYSEDINITKSLWFRSAGKVEYKGIIQSNGFPVTFEGESGNSFAAVNLYPKSVEDEILGLKNPDHNVRFVSLMLLARENDSRAIEPMTALLYDDDKYVRVAAAEALLKAGISSQAERGVALYLTGKKEAGLEIIDKAVKQDSAASDAWFSKGFVLMLQKNHSESIDCYQKAIDLNQSFIEAWLKEGSLLKDLSRYDKALICYKKALGLRQNDPAIWHETGAVLLECGNLSGAWDCYDRALEMGSKDAALWSSEWMKKGDSFCKSGRYSQAVECYNASLRLNSKDPALWNSKGCALAAQGMYDEAVKCFLHSTALDPAYSPPWYNKGVVLRHMGRMDEALKCYDEAIRLSPAYPDIWSARGDVLEALGRNSEADADYAAAKKLNKKSDSGSQSISETRSKSRNIITERTEIEAERRSSMNSSQSAPVYSDPQIDDIIASWKSHLGNESKGGIGKTASKSLASQSTTPRCICNSSGDQSDPVLGGNDQVGYYVAWMDNRSVSPDIYLYSLALEKELPFAVGQYEDMYPDIDSDTITWISRNPLNKYAIEDYWSIWAFNMSNASAKELLLGICNVAPISLRDDYLTYTDMPVRSFGTMIYKKLLHGVETAPTIPPSGSNPRSGGDIVVFQSHRNFQGYKNDSWDIYIWKRGGSPVPLQSDGYDQINPSTDGHTVVWQDNRSGNWDIYAYDLNSSREMQITNNQANQTHPDVDNGIIIWQDDRNGSWDLYAHDLKAKKERAICTDVGNQTQPRIRTGRIVWTDDRSGDRDIYLCKSPAV
ncbi:MAG: photosystem I assembly protein Ycf3 [Methanosaeta sp. PtaU1.Bin060]|nr:MAG: photosystem I assembly protein Ycf3 [Methanosaeta sp. PtaU1.Bin060]